MRGWATKVSLTSRFRMTGVTACDKTERKPSPQADEDNAAPKTRFQRKLVSMVVRDNSSTQFIFLCMEIDRIDGSPIVYSFFSPVYRKCDLIRLSIRQ